MTLDLPAPVAAYFAANGEHDVEGMLAPFAEDATVKDEGAERQGRAAIRAWIEATTAQYRATAKPLAVAATDGGLVVTSVVSGTFPGSPVTLRFAFSLRDGGIARLEIAS